MFGLTIGFSALILVIIMLLVTYFFGIVNTKAKIINLVLSMTKDSVKDILDKHIVFRDFLDEQAFLRNKDPDNSSLD